jgi:ferric-dicitrate binding protein FerR (iron transport regulator)
MTPENARMDPALERAISEIREEVVSDEVVAAAAARVWGRLAHAPEHIRSCADFQALIPDFRARRLPEARALLLEDHLHECVACRHVFEGKVVPLPVNFPERTQSAPRPARTSAPRWAIAAGILATGGLVAWFTIVQFGGHSGRAVVQSVNGTLYEVSANGIRVMTAGEMLPDGVEIRTARDSSAMLALRDGSQVEMRERSDFSTSQSASDVTVHLGRGSIIVQAAKRRSGHLYVATADCRVAVTGTVFGVSAGVKGSRVSVVQGEVHVTQDNHEQVLHEGDQVSTGASLEPVNLKDDFAWSRNPSLLRQLAALRENLNQLHMPQVRYSSRLVGLLPASTIFYASIPNLAQYLGEARNVFRQRAQESPELQAWLSGRGAAILPVLEKLKAANEYLGDEIAIFGVPNNIGPVFLAEVKREGFPQFLKNSGLPVAVEMRGNLALFSPNHDALAVALDSGFARTPFYARIAEAYKEGAGLLLCADLEKMSPHPVAPGMRYLIAEQREIEQHMETRAAIGFEGPRTGIASWLGPPAPMGALDYVSPEATFVMAFAMTNPAAILDQAVDQAPEFLPKREGSDVHAQIAASLGGEFALAMDGQPLPVPSWKLVAEVYDRARFDAAIQKAVSTYNLRFSQETVDGRTFYTIGLSDPNPLTEAHYTFASGYLIAAPTRALVTRALQVKANGAGIARTPGFLALLPRDHYTNASALIYQNIGTSLAPFAGLLGPKAAENMSNVKPFLIAAYGEPDRIALASTGDMLGMSLNNLLSGSVFNMANNALPWSQVPGTTRPAIPSR